jgi:hypothetical protein
MFLYPFSLVLSQKEETKLAKRKSRSLFIFSPVPIYDTANKKRFSPFWIYKQKHKLNL